MTNTVFTYPALIKEIYLDGFGHVNNTVYFTLYEEARWDFITKNGYGIAKIKETGQGPTILEAKISFLKELKARDEIIIESQSISYDRKIGKMSQKMIRSGEICSTGDFTFGLFDVSERKLVLPTPDWLYAIGIQQS